MKLIFVKRLDTPKNSIFYSLILYKDTIIAFGRKRYNQRLFKKVTLNEHFDIIEEDPTEFRGEDPRCFEYNHKLYVLDNHCNDMFLMDYESKHYTKMNISGKNISFLQHNNVLYFIHYIKPFQLYTFDIETGVSTRVEVDDDKCTYNYEYRGGTNGYKLNDNEYYGFGHRTYIQDTILKHDIFKWIVYFEENKLPRISHFDIEQPIDSKDVCDPTSILELNGKKYMITAESDKSWFYEQDYVTNVYEMIE